MSNRIQCVEDISEADRDRLSRINSPKTLQALNPEDKRKAYFIICKQAHLHPTHADMERRLTSWSTDGQAFPPLKFLPYINGTVERRYFNEDELVRPENGIAFPSGEESSQAHRNDQNFTIKMPLYGTGMRCFAGGPIGETGR